MGIIDKFRTTLRVWGFLSLVCFACPCFAQNDWRTAYAIWQDTLEAAEATLNLGRLADELGGDEATQILITDTLGNLQERALLFLAAKVPPEQCAGYADALFQVAVVVTELFPDDVERLFRQRVIQVLSACPYQGIKQEIVFIPWLSKWQIKFQWQEVTSPRGYRQRLTLNGEFALPELLPHLKELLGSSKEFNEALGQLGREYFYGLLKSQALTSNMSQVINTRMQGNYRYDRESYSWQESEGRWQHQGNCPACPLRSIATVYKLRMEFDIQKPQFSLLMDLIKPKEDFPDSVEGQCTDESFDTRDGTSHTDTYPNKCNYTPHGGFNSSHWDRETLPFKNGTYVVEEYNNGGRLHKTSITLTCLANCP